MVLFEWDPAKAETNQRKHGVSFEDALQVFDDPYSLAEQDRIVGGEYRWQTIGLVEGVALVLVAHTVREEGSKAVIRIFSARRATRKERKLYEQNRQENIG